MGRLSAEQAMLSISRHLRGAGGIESINMSPEGKIVIWAAPGVASAVPRQWEGHLISVKTVAPFNPRSQWS